MSVGLLSINTKISAVEKQLKKLRKEQEALKDKQGANKQWVRQVRERERKFRKMTKPEKRVAVAKDVIAMIELDRIKPKAGTYLLLEGVEELRVTPKQEVQEVLMEAPSCTACAVGSVFYCTLLRADNLTVGEFNKKLSDDDHNGYYDHSWDDDDGADKEGIEPDFGYQGGLYASVKWLFGTKQLSLIECAFEISNSIGLDYPGNKAAQRACQFGGKFSKDSDRLAAIMQNIIDNEGTFKP